MSFPIEIYRPEDGPEIRVQVSNESVWLDAHLIARVFDVERPAVVKHIQNIYQTGELVQAATCSILEQVAADGKRRQMKLYNLGYDHFDRISGEFKESNTIPPVGYEAIKRLPV